MKKTEKEQIPLLNIERDPILVIFWLAFIGGIDYLTYYLFSNMNPWGFIVMIPAVVFSFLTLWLLLNPFAVFFDDKLEFKQSFFNNSNTIYFNDVKAVIEIRKGKLFVKYNDDDVDSFNLFSIKPAHKQLLLDSLREHVLKSHSVREKA